MLTHALLLIQLQIPAPSGYVNDFAGIIDPATERAMTVIIEEVRIKSGGEIAVVTLSDLEGRASSDVARDIGRQWGVGAQQQAGDPRSNAGVVMLLMPGARPGDGRADFWIATGRGAEGFLTDARTGRIRDQVGQVSVASGSYSQGLAVGVQLLAQAYAEEFGFELTGQVARVPPPTRRRGRGFPLPLLILIFIFMLFGRRRFGFLHFMLLSSMMGGGGRGGWGGGGFGGGGFGGFGGGGGFSGGGAGGRF